MPKIFGTFYTKCNCARHHFYCRNTLPRRFHSGSLSLQSVFWTRTRMNAKKQKNARSNPVILLNPSRGSCWKSLSNFFLSFPFSLSVSILILIFPLSHSVYGLHRREIACKGKITEYEIAILEQNERRKNYPLTFSSLPTQLRRKTRSLIMSQFQRTLHEQKMYMLFVLFLSRFQIEGPKRI